MSIDGADAQLSLFGWFNPGDPPRSAHSDSSAGPDQPLVPGQEAAPGGDGSSVGPERRAGAKVSGLQEGAS